MTFRLVIGLLLVLAAGSAWMRGWRGPAILFAIAAALDLTLFILHVFLT